MDKENGVLISLNVECDKPETNGSGARIYVAGHRGLAGSALLRRLADQGTGI
jgi:hypothetical protein